MNVLKKVTLAVAGASLALSPVVAQAAASPLSVADYVSARDSAPTTNESEFGGSAIGLIMLAVVAAGIIYAIIEIADDSGDGTPSP